MSSGGGPLPRDAVGLLLELLELPTPVLVAGAVRLARGSKALLASGLLVPDGDEEAVADTDEMDDSLVPLIPVGDQGLGYYSPNAGIVPLKDDVATRYRVDVAKVLTRLAGQFTLARTRPTELVDGIAWEIGAARLPGRKARVPIWFARRLWDARSRSAVTAALSARPHGPDFVLLTSSDPARLGDVDIQRTFLVPVRDVLAVGGGLVVDAGLLSRRLGGHAAQAVRAGPIVLSPDHRLLTINGTVEVRFNPGAAQSAIWKLVDAYRDGQRRLPIRELTKHGNMRRLFGPRWAALQPYLDSVDGGWGFNV